jgi:H+/Cl- antiporter ClcA
MINLSLTHLTGTLRAKSIILPAVSIIVGVGAGVLGMLLALLLHFIQHLAYGYSPDLIISNESFLTGVSAASSQRRVLILGLCGLVAGLGWWSLYRFGKPLVSIADSIATQRVMPKCSTIIHALLQIITIALGSPLGREVAPRELGALFAAWVSEHLGLTPEETRTMIACGAGAGLAAVYNVPLGGAVFVLEVLFRSYNVSILVPALIASATATLISWSGLGIETIYHVPNVDLDASIIIWAFVTSPIFGVAAFGFIQTAIKQRKNALHDAHMIWASILNFLLIGLLAIYLPVVLGNGKSPIELEFSTSVGVGLSALILLLRCMIIWSSVRVGAQGGLLTPSLANGALLAAVLGGVWCCIWETSVPFEGFIVIGATAFLAAAQKMPLTAIILVFEFTHIRFDFLVPIMIAVGGATTVFNLCAKKEGPSAEGLH